MSYQIIFTDELYHHGVRGQKWGVRRYQNTDGSYKSGAQGRYTDDGSPGVNKSRRASGGKSSGGGKSSKVKTGSTKEAKASKSKGPKKKMSTKKKVAIGLGVAGTALAAYGAYKYGKHIKDQARKNIIEEGRQKAIAYEAKAKTSQMRLAKIRKFNQGDKFYKMDREQYLHDAKWNKKLASAVNTDYQRKADKTAKSFRESYKYIKNAKQAGTYRKYL